jgi:hypothetical protein
VEPSFKLVAYSNQLVQIFNPRNFPTYPSHDRLPGLLWVNKHVQPSSEACMNDLAHWLYGGINAVGIAQYITAMEQSGDMHIAIYDYGQGQLYISNASPSGWVQGVGKARTLETETGASLAGAGAERTRAGTEVVPAYARQFFRFNVTQLWATSL